MSSFFEDVCVKIGQLKQIGGGPEVTERNWHAVSLYLLGQPFASVSPLEPHEDPLGTVLLAVLHSEENKIHRQDKIFKDNQPRSVRSRMLNSDMPDSVVRTFQKEK